MIAAMTEIVNQNPFSVSSTVTEFYLGTWLPSQVYTHASFVVLCGDFPKFLEINHEKNYMLLPSLSLKHQTWALSCSFTLFPGWTIDTEVSELSLSTWTTRILSWVSEQHDGR